MKTIFRFLSLGFVMTAFVALATTMSFAQTEPAAAPTPDPRCADVDGQTAAYTKVTDNYAKNTPPEMKIALAAGKEFLEKYGACEALKDQIGFVKPQVARLEKDIPVIEKSLELAPFFKRFDAGINTDNADEIFAAGKEILARQPDNIQILIPLGVVGLREAYNKNNKHADDSIKYGRMALNHLKGGKPCEKLVQKAMIQECGALKYQFKRDDAISELTYAIAYQTFYAKNDKKGALPLYYEIAQGTTKYKDEPRVYATIGSYFAAELPRLNGDVAKLIEKQKLLPTDDEKIKMEPEIKAAIALVNGYAERAIDGYARAYKIAKSGTPAEKTYKDAIYKDLTVLYKGRFDKTDGMDTYIAAVAAKPMPDPSTEVTPVSDPEPTTTTTTTTGQPATASPATANPAAAVKKPVSAVTPKTLQEPAETAKTPSTSTVAVKAKPVTKKPVAKKKGRG